MTADMVANHYGISALYGQGALGQGVRVALFESAGFVASSVQGYLSCYGISTPISVIPVAGGAGGQADEEVTLDIEVVAGMAPQANILVYEGPNNNAATVALYGQIAQDNRAQVVSSSWGNCEAAYGSGQTLAESELFAEMALQGQSMFAADGDAGSEACSELASPPSARRTTPSSTSWPCRIRAPNRS
jgi:subtilase family serine protease